MRYSLRTLIVLMLLGGPACAWGYQEWQAHKAREALRLQREKDAKFFPCTATIYAINKSMTESSRLVTREGAAKSGSGSGFTPTLDFQFEGGSFGATED